MKRIYIIGILISLFEFTSCVKEIEFTDKLLEPKLVVNALCTADSIIHVELSASKPIPGYESPFTYVTDATVKLYVDGTETEDLKAPELSDLDEYFLNDPEATQMARSYYRSQTRVTSGKHYKIVVSHPNYKTVMSEMTMIDKVPIIGFDTLSSTVKNRYNEIEEGIKASIQFSDPANEENYYRLIVSYKYGQGYAYEQSPGDTVYNVNLNRSYNNNLIMSDDPVISSNTTADDVLFDNSGSKYTVFSDELFNGKTYNLSFYLDPWITNQNQYSNSIPAKGKFFIATVELQSLTKEAYYYIKSVGMFDWNNEGLFTEPVQVYNNIENGLGIFGGISSSSLKIQKGEYPIDGVTYYGNND